MTHIVFYEKPGCGNNTRQKKMLADAGHQLEVRNLLTEPWTAQRLLAFFEGLPVTAWFNRAAPRVKSGEIVPERMDAEAALALMLEDHLLIRRPLMETGDRRHVGFDVAAVEAWLGSSLTGRKDQDLQTCRK